MYFEIWLIETVYCVLECSIYSIIDFLRMQGELALPWKSHLSGVVGVWNVRNQYCCRGTIISPRYLIVIASCIEQCTISTSIDDIGLKVLSSPRNYSTMMPPDFIQVEFFD